MFTSDDSLQRVTVVKRFRKGSAPAEDCALQTAQEEEPHAVLVSDTESVQASSTSASPFQVAAAKAGPGSRFHKPMPLPTCARTVQPRFRSPFQLGHAGAVASGLDSSLPASVAVSMPSSDKVAKPLPAFLPVEPSRPTPPKRAPLPRPSPRQASFYANCPSDPVASGSVFSNSPAKAASPFLAKPLAEDLAAPTREWQPHVHKSIAGFVSSRQVHQERSSAVLSLFSSALHNSSAPEQGAFRLAGLASRGRVSDKAPA